MCFTLCVSHEQTERNNILNPRNHNKCVGVQSIPTYVNFGVRKSFRNVTLTEVGSFLYRYYKKTTQPLKPLRIPLILIFTRAVRDTGQNSSCGLLPQKGWTTLLNNLSY